MSRLGIFIADGCEEVEALTVVDIVRRAKLEIDMISINGTKQVTSSRNVTFIWALCLALIAANTAINLIHACLSCFIKPCC